MSTTESNQNPTQPQTNKPQTRRHTEWREDLKSLYRAGGVAGRPTAFLLDETQIKYESFLEDVNNVLTSGEVPNLFPKVRALWLQPKGCWDRCSPGVKSRGAVQGCSPGVLGWGSGL